MRSSRPHQGRPIVAFDGGHDRGAEALHGGAARRAARRPATPCGCTSSSARGGPAADGPVGTVAAVEANPASDLLVLDGGGLVPLPFVVGRRGGGRLVVDLARRASD